VNGRREKSVIRKPHAKDKHNLIFGLPGDDMRKDDAIACKLTRQIRLLAGPRPIPKLEWLGDKENGLRRKQTDRWRESGLASSAAGKRSTVTRRSDVLISLYEMSGRWHEDGLKWRTLLGSAVPLWCRCPRVRLGRSGGWRLEVGPSICGQSKHI
jgi:hypothetical protein